MDAQVGKVLDALDRLGLASNTVIVFTSDHDQDVKELTNLADNPAQGQTVADLSARLRQAIATTFPADGQTPILRPNLWAPNLTKP